MNSNQLYPLKFQPIFKYRIWGGNKLRAELKKNTTADQIGESWEIADVDGDETVVQDGSLKGSTLKKLIQEYKSELVGKKVYDVFGDSFPLLIKFIDAHLPLSIQVHPNDAIAKDPNYTCIHLKKDQLQKFAEDFSEVYNKAWAGHGGLKEISKEQVLLLFKKMKPVMDEKIIWFAYHQNRPIAIFINLPDLNQWFKHLHGKFGLIHKLKFLWLKQFKKNNKFTGLVFGVIPEFQGKGVDAYIIGSSAKLVQSDELHYTKYEMQWIGEFNPKMINIAQHLGDVYESRRLTTYRYQFDPTIPFKRHPILA